MTGAHGLVVAEDDLEVSQAQPSGVEAGQRIVEPRPLLNVCAINGHHGFDNRRPTWPVRSETKRDDDSDGRKSGTHPATVRVGARSQMAARSPMVRNVEPSPGPGDPYASRCRASSPDGLSAQPARSGPGVNPRS